MRNPSMFDKLSGLTKPIRVAVAGCGEFSFGLVSQVGFIPNMKISAVADLNPVKARSMLNDAGISDEHIVYTNDSITASKQIMLGNVITTEDAFMLAKLPVDVLCDVTGDPAFGAEYAANGISNEKHVVVVNIESDVGVGAILRRMADDAGVVYTEADGDQPSLIMGLMDYCKCLGINVEVAGKWTHLKPYTINNGSAKRSDEGFADGSKNQVEMCCVANMTGFLPDVPGMHFPSLALDEIIPTLSLKEMGGILNGTRVVETVNCLTPDGKNEVEKLFGGGVFVIASGNHRAFSKIAASKGFISNLDGTRVLLFRPFHFVGIETPISIMKACLYGIPTAAPLRTPCADVITIAKRDLKQGEKLDGIGGETVRGIMVTRKASMSDNLLPLVLAQGVKVSRDIKQGECIKYSDLVNRLDNTLWKLRAEQDSFEI